MDKCMPCAAPYLPMSATFVAVVVLLMVVAIYYIVCALSRGRREKFAARRERARVVHGAARELFDQKGEAATYSEFKTRVGDADPVLYFDLRNLNKKGRLTPEEVEKTL